MPGAYTPEQTRRTQAVRSPRAGRGQTRWRLRWLLPLLGILPFVVVVAAAEGLFSNSSSNSASPPLANGPVANTTSTPLTVATPAATSATPATTATANANPTSGPVTANPTSGAVTANANPGTAAATPTSGTVAAGAPSATPASAGTGTTTSSGTDGGGPYLAYHVQRGDTLSFIARSYGVSVASIAQASGIANPDRLRVGQLLTIPKQPGWLYRVQPGETLDQIAARNGVSSDAVVSASGLTAASVEPGQVLLIPDTTATPQGK